MTKELMSNDLLAECIEALGANANVLKKKKLI